MSSLINNSKLVTLFLSLALASTTTTSSHLALAANNNDACNLCSNGKQTISVDKCKDVSLTSIPFQACCQESADTSACTDGRACRSVEFSTKLGCGTAPGESAVCMANPGRVMQLSFSMALEQKPGICCANCHCGGDPHCYNFLHQADDWVICDARDTSKGCALTQAQCAKELDALGNQCVWDPNQSKGSTCHQPFTDPAPTMEFYTKGSTSIWFTLGIRGIITGVTINQGKNKLILDSETCLWTGTPKGLLTSTNKGKGWNYIMNDIKASVRINCIAKGTLVTSPHLDVTVVDSTGTSNGSAPPKGVTGYCASPKIQKGKSTTENSDTIRTTGACTGQSQNAIAAQYFNNGKPVGANKVPRIAKTFCYKYIVGRDKKAISGQFNGSNKVKKCYKQIIGKNGPGWPRVFCAANTLLSKNADDCLPGDKASADCVTCVNDIMDFGWDYAVQKWDITKTSGSKPGGQCVTIESLPPDLLQCQGGIRIQYLDSNNVWTTYKAIPSGYRLCPGSGTFDSAANPELFDNLVRILQCGPTYDPTGTVCPTQTSDLCDAREGVSLTVNLKATNDFSQVGILDMIEKGMLVCNPKLYPKDPKGCLNEPVVPCAGCKKVCPSTNFIPPCTDCGICADDSIMP